MAKRTQSMAKQDQLQDVQRNNLQELVKLPAAVKRATIEVIMQKWKCKALLSQESNGEGSVESKFKMGDDMIVVGRVDEMLTTLQKGNRVNSVASTGGLEHLIL